MNFVDSLSQLLKSEELIQVLDVPIENSIFVGDGASKDDKKRLASTITENFTRAEIENLKAALLVEHATELDESAEIDEISYFAKKVLKNGTNGQDLSCIDLSGADLSHANLSNANLSGADLINSNLSGVDLSNANLSGADLSGAILISADLRGADLWGANLSSTDLIGAILSDADLSGAILSDADLTSADLTRANLTSADLSGADLWSANLSDVDLSGAILNCADFTLAKNITIKRIKEAFNWEKAKYSAVFRKKLALPNYLGVTNNFSLIV